MMPMLTSLTAPLMLRDLELRTPRKSTSEKMILLISNSLNFFPGIPTCTITAPGFNISRQERKPGSTPVTSKTLSNILPFVKALH